ncbi:MAG: phytanoyl-CoA dioxygenase family protein [Planctomycetota bacterium]|nr:phytanoyl-CoA dioxygenase family protein [Planctomycetota bacterium]
MLTPDQIAQFYAQGFLTIEPLFTPAEVDAACRSISRLIRDKVVALDIEPAVKAHPEVVADPELAVRKLMFFTAFDPLLKSLCEHRALVGAVEQLMGEPSVMAQDMALLKPPFFGVAKPWHQDNAYFRWTPPEKVVGAWIALDEATIDNGCMQVVPGTHKAGPVAHFHLRDCQIPDDRVATARKLAVPLRPGGCLLFSGLLHHGTEDNTSPARRRALQFHYRGASCRQMSDQDHGRLFNEDHKYAGCAIWPREKAEELVVA